MVSTTVLGVRGHIGLPLSYRTALDFQLLHRTATAFGCQTQKAWESFLWRRNLEKLSFFGKAEQGRQPNSVSTLWAGPWWQVRHWVVLSSQWLALPWFRWSCLCPVFFGGSPPGAGISAYRENLFIKHFKCHIQQISKSLRTIIYSECLILK